MNIPERLYQDELPEEGDFVMTKITRIDPACVYVDLLEYGMEGMLPLREISDRKVRNIHGVLRVGMQECMQVLYIDPDKGYVDLTRRKILPDEIEECSIKYNLAKKLHSYFSRWSNQSSTDLVSTILFLKSDYNTFMNDRQWLRGVPDEWRTKMEEDFNRIFEKKAQKYEALIEMICYSPDGISAIQSAIDKAHNTYPDVQCIYTGKSGDIGTIYQLTTVSKDDNASDILNLFVETVTTALSPCESKVIKVDL